MTQQNVAETTLRITKDFSAPICKVFEAITDPQQVVQWMGPGDVTCKNVEIDLKVGGKYLIHMVGEDGDHIAIGEYKEIIQNKRLQYTWSWKSGTVTDSLVTIELEDKGGVTQLTLSHENFPSKEAAEKHTMGWNACLDNLQKLLG